MFDGDQVTLELGEVPSTCVLLVDVLAYPGEVVVGAAEVNAAGVLVFLDVLEHQVGDTEHFRLGGGRTITFIAVHRTDEQDKASQQDADRR